MRINIPNQVTLGRLILTLVFFVLLSLFHAGRNQDWLLLVCFWVFLVAALSDILDGLLARWLKQETTFGRVLDPIVDKVMVCGAFVLFAGPSFVGDEGRNITDVKPWMVVVILIREFLVSGIRAHAEASGREFAATWAGKLKMFIQSATVCVILGQLGWERLQALAPLRTACVWLTVVVTALSIVTYARRARAFLLASEERGAPPGSREDESSQEAGAAPGAKRRGESN